MAASKVTVSVPEGRAGRLVRLVVNCAQIGDKCELESTEGSVEATTLEGAKLTGINAICRYLCSISKEGEGLLGSTSELAAEISQWLSFVQSDLSPLVDEKLKKLNDFLAPRVWFVGSSLTLADLAIYIAVHPAVSMLPVAQTGHFCNLIRWTNFIHHSVDKEKVAASFQVPIPAFNFSPPSPPPQPASKATSKGEPSEGKNGTSKSTASAGSRKEAGNNGKGAEAKSESASSNDKGEGKKAKKEKKEKKEKEPAKKKEIVARIDMLDLRVGKIVKVDKHPDADALYLEEIDLGEEKPRQVISGLVKFVPVEKMQDRHVVVCCNLKPAKMRGIMSYGMVLCASDQAHEKCDPISPPEGVPIGEKVTFEGYSEAHIEEIKPKQQILDKLFPDLVTDESGAPKYKDAAFMTSKGPVTGTIPNGFVR